MCPSVHFFLLKAFLSEPSSLEPPRVRSLHFRRFYKFWFDVVEMIIACFLTVGPSGVEITGVDVITVGIPYGFECWANCYPGCRFTWTRGNVTSEGPELNLQLRRLEPTVAIACTAVNPASGSSVTVQKRLQVTGRSDARLLGGASPS